MEEHDPRNRPEQPQRSEEFGHRQQSDLHRHHQQRHHDQEDASRPGKSSQAKAYPASAAITTTSTVAGTEISTVFQNACVMPGFFSSAE